ncbi:MAG: Triacylglycerol lipase, partial [Marmoricola sp.]|nr:Triacylglycerol lipase [Marmoricola sp.]
VGRYVDGGATVCYVRDRASEHIGLMLLAQPMMLAWLEARFASRPAPAGQVTAALALAPRSWSGYVTLLGTTARLLTGRGGRARRRRLPRSAATSARPGAPTAGAA